MNNVDNRPFNEIYEETLTGLVNKHRFYANFLMNMKLKLNKKLPAPAGVSIKDGINLYINPDSFSNFNLTGRMEILMHEAAHVYNEHIIRAKELECDNHSDFMLHNIASDSIINEPLKELHEYGITKNKIKELLKDDKLDMNEISEYYYLKLKDYRNKNKEELEKLAEQMIGDHECWKESDDNTESLKHTIANTLKKAVDQSGGIGNCPGEVVEALENLTKSTVRWERELKRFFARANKFKRESSRKKRNRRYGILYPGKQKKPDLNIVICVDTSGSVSNEWLAQFFTEIDKIYKLGYMIKIIECDMQVNAIYDYTPKMNIEVKGRGGTAVEPAIEEAMKYKPDGIIYLTDGGFYINKNFKTPKVPFLWGIIENEAFTKDHIDFGKIIHIKEYNNEV